MGEYLVIANQTIGGAELDEAIRHRVESGFTDFYVLAPMVAPELEAEGWIPADPVMGMRPSFEATAAAAQEARRRAEWRLHALLERIRAAGGQADGEVGSSDPIEAVEQVLDRHVVDEVIVSTLPAGISRWLKMDLPSRISRRVDVPVTTIEAQRAD